MRRLIPYYALFISSILVTCQDFERQILLKTNLESQSDSLIVVNGQLLDGQLNNEIKSYGHCWSESGIPDIVNSAKTIFVDKSALVGNELFISSIDEFSANKTYFIRTYIEYTSGYTFYGDVLKISTGQTRGRWERKPSLWKWTDLKRTDYLGEFNIQLNNVNFFVNAGFYQDNIIAGNGYLFQGLKNKKYLDPNIESDTSIQFGNTMTSLNNLIKILEENEDWKTATILPGGGYGGIGITDDNFFYVGGGTKSMGALFAFFFQIYNPWGSNEGGIANNFSVLDIQNNSWLSLAPFPGPKSVFGVSFLLDNNIYKVSGWDGINTLNNEAWKYSISENKWTQLSNFPGVPRMHAVSFMANGKAYVGGGFTELQVYIFANFYLFIPKSPVNDFWEYDPGSDSWSRIEDFPGMARGGAFSFGIEKYGYVGCGSSGPFNKYLKDFWRYSPEANTWQRLNDFPGKRRFGATGFSNKKYGAAGFGYIIEENSVDFIDPRIDFNDPDPFHYYNPVFDSDFWIYNPDLN